MAFSALRALMANPPLALPNNWIATDNAFGVNHSAFDIAYGENLFVAVGGIAGNNPFIKSSPDGVVWTTRAVFHSSNVYVQVFYGDGLFIITGLFDSVEGRGAIVTSPDGINWTNRTATSNLEISSAKISLANGTYFATGKRKLYSSADGLVWTSRHLHSLLPMRLGGIAFGNGVYCCVGNQIGALSAGTLDSSDGITWTERVYPDSVNYFVGGLLWDGSRFVCSGADSNRGGVTRIESSANGIAFTFENQALTGVGSMDFRRGLYTMVGSTGFNLDAKIAQTPAKDVWSEYTIIGSRPASGLAFSPSRAVIVGATVGAGQYITWVGYQNI